MKTILLFYFFATCLVTAAPPVPEGAENWPEVELRFSVAPSEIDWTPAAMYIQQNAQTFTVIDHTGKRVILYTSPSGDEPYRPGAWFFFSGPGQNDIKETPKYSPDQFDENGELLLGESPQYWYIVGHVSPALVDAINDPPEQLETLADHITIINVAE